MTDSTLELDTDLLGQLIPPGIFTHAELSAREHAEIAAARRWAIGPRRRRLQKVLTEQFLLELHGRMFGTTWSWAGELHTNAGGNWADLPAAFRDAIADIRIWLNGTVWTPQELAARIHHRLVTLHPFVDGNGRWSRLATDLLMHTIREPLPGWGRHLNSPTDNPGQAYLDALRAADRGHFNELIDFMWGTDA